MRIGPWYLIRDTGIPADLPPTFREELVRRRLNDVHEGRQRMIDTATRYTMVAITERVTTRKGDTDLSDLIRIAVTLGVEPDVVKKWTVR
jgi:hypothetical protein